MKRHWLACVVVGIAALMVAGCGETSSTAFPLEGFVCGKDGRTYSVEDAANGERDVEHRGRCDAPMHCDSPVDCFVGDACMPMPGDAEAHWCIPGPTRCNCPGVFEPVCGGDGRNYINACEAACAGVGIQYAGYCEEPPGHGCVRAGCSDHLCVEEGMDIASTCEWRPVYACYQEATCERQQNGQCGFTPTHELVECLERFGEGMCRVDPRWQDGFKAECESPQVPGIVGLVFVTPYEMLRLGEPFGAGFELLEPPVFGGVFEGEGLLFCDGEQTLLEGRVAMTPLGDLEFVCKILPDDRPGECYDDGDCPPGHYCERFHHFPPGDHADSSKSHPLPPPPGVCVDLCALIDCAPGYVCEAGECVPQQLFCGDDFDCPVGYICERDGVPYPGMLGPDAPDIAGVCERCGCPEIYAPVCGVDGQTYGNECEARCAHVRVAYEGECSDDCPETHVRNFDGECVPKCYGPEQCPDGKHCNAAEVCLQDPACPACDVCVGWCEPPIDDCRPTGCNGEICADQPMVSPCVALPEFACYREVGICERQPWGGCGWTPTPELDECLSQFDCRATGCGEGTYCGFCWTSWACIPDGAVC